jgi:hypothetical protein
MLDRFHLEVPVGKWHTVTAGPVSAANRVDPISALPGQAGCDDNAP